MPRSLIVIVSLLLLVPACKDKPIGQAKVTGGAEVTLRAEPVLIGHKIGTIADGARVALMKKGPAGEVNGMRSHWYKVQAQGKEGWVFGHFLAIDGADNMAHRPGGSCKEAIGKDLKTIFLNACLDEKCDATDRCKQGSAFLSGGQAELWRDCHGATRGTWQVQNNKIVVTATEKITPEGFILNDCIEDCMNGLSEEECDKECNQKARPYTYRVTYSLMGDNTFSEEFTLSANGDYGLPKDMPAQREARRVGCLRSLTQAR